MSDVPTLGLVSGDDLCELERLGMIEFVDGEVVMTEAGRAKAAEIMEDAALVAARYILRGVE